MRHSVQDKNIQNNMTITAIGTAYLVFLTLVVEKYTLITYTRVSELPIITDAQSAGKLSAPYRSTSSINVAFDALPETGRVISRGRSSDGIPILSPIGDNIPTSQSTAPDAFSIEMATINATIVGRRLKHVIAPSFAPDRNPSKYFFFGISESNATAIIISGIMTADIVMLMFFHAFRLYIRFLDFPCFFVYF